jgi:hypothetical protein
MSTIGKGTFAEFCIYCTAGIIAATSLIILAVLIWAWLL